MKINLYFNSKKILIFYSTRNKTGILKLNYLDFQSKYTSSLCEIVITEWFKHLGFKPFFKSKTNIMTKFIAITEAIYAQLKACEISLLKSFC